MKKLQHIILFSFFSFTTFCQNFVSNNYQDFIEAESSSVVQVNGATFQLAADFLSNSDGENTDEIKEALRSVKSFQLVAMPDLENPSIEYTNGLEKLRGAYNELMSIKDHESRFSVQIDEEDGVVYEIVGLGTEADEGKFIAFSLSGAFPIELVGEILDKAQSKGGKNLTTLLDKKSIDNVHLKVFPNPTSANNNITVEIPENLIGGRGLFVDLNGRVISSFEIDTQVKELNTKGLTPGYYMISLTNEGTTIKRKVNVIR